MAKTYSGGIGIATGFKLSDPQPIADYMVVDLISDLSSITNQFIGMFTFVKEDDNFYTKKSTGWATISVTIDESNLVHLDGTETITGVKTFTQYVTALGFKTPTGSGTGFLKDNGSVDTTTYENITNKVNVISGTSSSEYPTENAVVNYVNSNFSLVYRDEFIWTSGTQSFTLTQNFSQIWGVTVQGAGVLKADQYTVTAPNIITITDPLDSGDYIVVLYAKTSLIAATGYTQAEVDALLLNKMDKIRATKIVPDPTYTIINSDSDKILYFTSTTAVTITIPSGLTVGNAYEVFQQGTGQLSFVGSGATLRYSSLELPTSSERYALIGIDSITNVSDEYHLYGQLTAI